MSFLGYSKRMAASKSEYRGPMGNDWQLQRGEKNRSTTGRKHFIPCKRSDALHLYRKQDNGSRHFVTTKADVAGANFVAGLCVFQPSRLPDRRAKRFPDAPIPSRFFQHALGMKLQPDDKFRFRIVVGLNQPILRVRHRL